MILPSGSSTGIEDGQLKFTLSADTHSIVDFNAKVEVAVLKQRQDCESPQIKNLKLIILWSITHLWPLIVFLLRLAYLATMSKRLHAPSSFTPWNIEKSLDTHNLPKIIITAL